MDIFPAIDIRHGRVVRLTQGEAARETVYEQDPVAQAERFVEAGARWVHVIDLDRAFGDGDNTALVAAICRRVPAGVRVQAGGGFRTLDRVREALDAGASRVVIGTAAVSDPALVPQAVAAAGGERLAIGLDAREGRVAVRGWVETSELTVAQVARRVVAEGVRTVIYTDIARDGTLAGPDVEGAVALQRDGAQVIASGGVASLEHLKALAAAGLVGAIVGRALYERRFTLTEALAACASPS